MFGEIIIIIIAIIAVLYSYYLGKFHSEICNLEGFWNSDSSFNNESGLKNFTLYIGPYECGAYSTYFLMIDNEDKMLINTPTTMKLTSSNFFNCGEFHEFNACLPELNSDFIPNNIIIKYYPKSNKILLLNEDIVYGCLFKNPVLTEISIIKEQNKKNNSNAIPDFENI